MTRGHPVNSKRVLTEFPTAGRQPAGGAEGSLGVTLVNLSRGTHQLDAVVVNASGETVASAGPVTFHVLRVHRPAPRPQPH
mgnify:CR=1 FL=1